MRKLSILVPLLVTVGVLAAPAAAKPGHGSDEVGVAVVTISGRALDPSILWSGDPAWKLLYVTTFRASGTVAPEPPADLGPALRASYRFVEPGGAVLTLEQDLFPCAEPDAVWARTSAGQDDVRQRHGEPVSAGWQRTAALYATLRESGMPACEEIGSAPAGTSSTGGGDASTIGVWLGLAAVGALIAIGALGSRTSRSPVPGRSGQRA